MAQRQNKIAMTIERPVCSCKNFLSYAKCNIDCDFRELKTLSDTVIKKRTNLFLDQDDVLKQILSVISRIGKITIAGETFSKTAAIKEVKSKSETGYLLADEVLRIAIKK